MVVDVVTRWWSTYHPIEQHLHLKRALGMMILREQITQTKSLTNKEWVIWRGILTVLGPFKKAQQKLEGENCVTISWVPRMIFYIKVILNLAVDLHRVGSEDENYASHTIFVMASKMNVDFENLWENQVNGKFNSEVVRGDFNR